MHVFRSSALVTTAYNTNTINKFNKSKLPSQNIAIYQTYNLGATIANESHYKAIYYTNRKYNNN